MLKVEPRTTYVGKVAAAVCCFRFNMFFSLISKAPFLAAQMRMPAAAAIGAIQILPNNLTVTIAPFAAADQQVRHRSNRSRRGLYDGKDIRTGNNVSFSMRHTKRTFKPNVFIKKVYSEILDDMIQFHLTTATL